MANSSNETDVADQAYELGDQIDSFVDERPLTALAIAVLVGALLGRYVFSSHEIESPADHSSTTHGRASDLFESLRHRIT